MKLPEGYVFSHVYHSVQNAPPPPDMFKLVRYEAHTVGKVGRLHPTEMLSCWH